MPSANYIALLRAVNLAHHRKLAMADLRAMIATEGFEDPRTLLNSGNVVFRGSKGPARIERALEAQARKRFGFEIDFMVRTAGEWDQLIACNPFPEEASRDPAHLLVLVLKERVDRPRVVGLQAAIAGREVIGGEGRHLYAVYPDGIGRSKLTTMVIEKKLGVRVTARNWNTVLKLKELACRPPGR